MISTTQTTPEYDLDRELEQLYSGLSSRSFSYSPNSDPLYRSYADSYRQMGKLAMRDSMGQAADLSGGYGSSYAQSVGQQQYNSYLRSLSDALPRFYDMAYKSYAAETEKLQSLYDMNLSKQQAEAKAAADKEKQDYERQQDSYKKLIDLISTAGYSPKDEELEATGLTRAQAEALLQLYLRENGLLPTEQSSPSPGGDEYYVSDSYYTNPNETSTIDKTSKNPNRRTS